MSNSATRRLQQEISLLKKNPIPGVSIDVNSENQFEWNCSILADDKSPYKGGTFHFTITFNDFPFKAPSVTIKTKIYHPGVDDKGAICVPILAGEWKPSVRLDKVLSVIQEKINNPSPDDPFEPDIASVLKDDKAKFLATAKEWTKKHAGH